MNFGFFLLDNLLPLMTFLLVYIGLFSGVMALIYSRRRARQLEIQDQNESLESKLRLLGQSATRASSLAKQITIEIDAMTAKAIHAEAAAENAQKIAELSDKEREAVAEMVRRELGGQLQGRGKRDFWTQVALSSVFFILGILASIFVVTPLVSKLA
ncbi:hypothetical protein ACFY5D_21435 [Paeniglutamicibacter sp. NPDC012692]|uniref:hypothetical protein n=1 Tax=Paeniglutamicibacter sp. NPDC012692 TaxID=3364388 RepID=UPI0036802A0F